MQLVNITNGSVLANSIELANTFKKRLKGLIGRHGLNCGEAVILYPCNSIHTFFMKFPIDVLFVDKEAVVLKTMENIKPFSLSPRITNSYMVVELPAGRLAATGTTAGNHLEIIVNN